MMFVSYSRDEMVATRKLVKDLSAEGIKCWFDESNIPVGQAFVEQLGRGLSEADCYLFVDTLASRASYWVMRELQTAFRYRRDGRYHSVFRIYATESGHIDTSDWDASMPLDSDAPIQIVKFISDRRMGQLVSDHGDVRENVTFLNKTGLGQPNNWAGRQDELRALDEWWLGSFPGVWLLGTSGIGKSGLLQTWITALSCLGYVEPVTVRVLYLQGREIDLTEAQNALRKTDDTSPLQFLLVVDGHDEARNTLEVEDFLVKYIHKGFRTLVTSRASIPPNLSRGFTKIQIGNLSRRDSVLMLNELGVTGPEREGLADELDNHPLALLLLSNFLMNESESVIELLENLRSMRSGVTVDGSSATHSIRAALRKCLQNLTSDARTLFETLCRSVDNVPSLLELQNPAIRGLEKIGLVQIDHFGEQKRISIHPLVREYINEEQSLTGHHRP